MHFADGSLWPLLGLAFALGLSHGADPDHLTAIDGMTRASVDRHPRMSRWVGTWFAFGHALSVLCIATLIALAAEYLKTFSHSVLQVGGVLSALLLLAIGTLNLARLVTLPVGVTAPSHGVIGHFLPGRMLNIAHPLGAVPIGALFGLGFETASQMSAWALAGTMGYGLLGALLIGVAFSSGMVVTDSINGLVVRRMYLAATAMATQGNRMMTLTVVGLAYVVGIIKLLQLTSFALPVSDMSLTIMVLGAVSLAFMAALVKAQCRVA
jgi:nickel/cobalt transporter (NiCoT) family protein